jgi:hypothetical protein
MAEVSEPEIFSACNLFAALMKRNGRNFKKLKMIPIAIEKYYLLTLILVSQFHSAWLQLGEMRKN